MEKMETEYGLVRVGRGKRSESQHIYTKHSDFLSLTSAYYSVFLPQQALYDEKIYHMNIRHHKNLYFFHNPQAQSRTGELMVAGYQKRLEGKPSLSPAASKKPYRHTA